MNLAKMLSAEEFYADECLRWPNKTEHLDYMDFAERYADYVVEHEKFIERTGLHVVERFENQVKR